MDTKVVSTTPDGRKLNRWGQQVIHCAICDEGTTMLGTELCDRCWELDRRIAAD